MKENLFNSLVEGMENYIMFTIKARQMELAEGLKAKNRAPIMLSMGAPIEPVPTFVKEKTAKYLLQDPLHTYSTPKGELRFLEAVSNRMKKRFDVELNPKTEVFSLIGSKEGLSNMIRALVNPKDKKEDQDVILTPNPGYASYSQMIKLCGANCYGIDLTEENNYMPDLYEVLEKYINEGNNPNKIKALIINYPNNPLGCTCDLKYLQHCVDFCNKLGILLISDNAYCEMYYDEQSKPHSALECEGAMDCCVEFHSLSKTYAMTGWRLGWACGNKTAITMLSRVKSTIDTGIFKVLQYAAADLIESAEGDKYIEEQNIKFEKKIRTFVEGLNKLGYKVKMPTTTFYLWVEIPERFENSKAFADAMLEKSGIVIVPGTGFSPDGQRHVRMSVVASDEDLAEVLKRMKEDGFEYES